MDTPAGRNAVASRYAPQASNEPPTKREQLYLGFFENTPNMREQAKQNGGHCPPL
jgi:hypothetical protein